MPHTLQGKNKLDGNIPPNRSTSEVKSAAGSFSKPETKALYSSREEGTVLQQSSAGGWTENRRILTQLDVADPDALFAFL